MICKVCGLQALFIKLANFEGLIPRNSQTTFTIFYCFYRNNQL